MKSFLITGGSGLVGKSLSKLLVEKGYKVLWLSRERNINADIPRYRWEYQHSIIDKEAVEQADIIIHLAGSNLGEDRWTRQKKQEIVDSRVQTAKLLFDTAKTLDKKPEAFISASAVGYYGVKTSEKIFTEKDIPSESHFLIRTCREWEAAAFKFQEELGVRTVVVRTGVVISKNSEAFKKMMLPTRFGLVSPLGNGEQYFSWIHIDDLCNIYLKAMEDVAMQGAYNGVAPEFITNSDFMHTLAKAMKRPFIMPKVPPFLMRLIMGEAADMILGGSRISSKKIEESGYEFQFSTAEKAITKEVRR